MSYAQIMMLFWMFLGSHLLNKAEKKILFTFLRLRLMAQTGLGIQQLACKSRRRSSNFWNFSFKLDTIRL